MTEYLSGLLKWLQSKDISKLTKSLLKDTGVSKLFSSAISGV